jgi:acyl-CoA synthetase (AMP-forming)/AMP-acid ligase II
MPFVPKGRATLGLKWKNKGEGVPKDGVEFENAPLTAALEKQLKSANPKHDFTEAELRALGVAEGRLSLDSYVKAAGPGELSELVLTTLGRSGAPVIRYRTGDLVRPRWPSEAEIAAGGRPWVCLDGGILGRTDDMLVVRGVNVFPGAIEDIVRSFPEVIEYRLTLTTDASLDMLLLEIEDHLAAPDRVARELQVRLGLRVDVQIVPIGSLPRFEGKARRVVDRRPPAPAPRCRRGPTPGVRFSFPDAPRPRRSRTSCF